MLYLIYVKEVRIIFGYMRGTRYEFINVPEEKKGCNYYNINDSFYIFYNYILLLNFKLSYN